MGGVLFSRKSVLAVFAMAAAMLVPPEAEAKIVVGGCDVFAGNPMGELRCLVGVVRRLEQDVANAVADGAKLGGAVLGQLKDTLTCLKNSSASQVVKEPGGAFTALMANAGTFLESLATEVWTSLVAKFREFVTADVAAATSAQRFTLAGGPDVRVMLDRVWARIKALAAGNTSLKCLTDAISPSVTELRRRIAPMVSAMKAGLQSIYETQVRPKIAGGIANKIKEVLRKLAGPEGEAAAKAVVAGYMVSRTQLDNSARVVKDLTAAISAGARNTRAKLSLVRTELDKTFQMTSSLVFDVVAELLRLQADAMIAKYAPPFIDTLLKPLGKVTLFFAGKISLLCGVIPVVGGAMCGSVVTGIFGQAWEEIVKPLLTALATEGLSQVKDVALNFAVAKLKERAGQRLDSAVDSALTALGPLGTEIRTVVNDTVYLLADNWVKPVAEALKNYNQNVKALAETAVERAK